VDKRDRQTRKVRWEHLDEVLAYDASDLDRDVVATDQIRTVLETFRDKVFTEMFPGRTDLPKTLIFAKDDTHADDIVRFALEQQPVLAPFADSVTERFNEWLMDICMFALAALLVSSASTGIPKVLALVVILAAAVYFTLELLVDIVVAGVCRWIVAMGEGLGVLVGSCRYGKHKR
jgi:hypothetical protein